ncbi:rho-related GTP-binding protein RhoU [Chanos chanos]|uniref:Rho-related GTP-binding protein RhoU n=1 Tax=Chanos chanos TaxID=29144 RepID=A0A6J2VP99_CHACN|nr:rho-related GTP-binding protein RhoU-like [Chanos chanos]
MPPVGDGVSRRNDEEPCAPPIPPRRTLNRDLALVANGRSALVPERKVKCVLVGDGAVGKTSLIVSYTTNGYPSEYIPTAFDNFAVKVVVDGRPIRLQLCDMAGQDEFDRLRPLCYRNTDAFLLCYSVVQPASFRNVSDRWAPEIRRLCPGVPVVLVGTQCDLREDVQVLIQLAERREKPISGDEARLCAHALGAASFIECSALTQKNLKEVFDAAILCSVQQAGGSDLRRTLRRKTPDKIKQLSETWWRKFSCFV